MKILLGILSFCFVINTSAQLEVGSIAPEINVDHIFNKKEEGLTSLAELKGNYVVLDFWATWCSPCVASFPKMDKMYREFKDKNVQFLAISTEKITKVKNFVEHTNYNFWIGVNESKEDFKNYKITAIPQVYVINPEGKIVHQAHHLSRKDLIEILEKGKVDKNEEHTESKNPFPYRGFSAGEDPLTRTNFFLLNDNNVDMPPLLEQEIVRHSLATKFYGSKMNFSGDTSKITFYGARLDELFSHLYGLSSNVYIKNQISDSSLYDIVLMNFNLSEKRAKERVRELIEHNLGIKIKWANYAVIENKLSINDLPSTAIHNDSVVEGTYYLYTPFKVFIKHLENKTGELYTMDKDILNYTLLNEGVDRGKLYKMSSEEIKAYLKRYGFKIEEGSTKIKGIILSEQ